MSHINMAGNTQSVTDIQMRDSVSRLVSEAMSAAENRFGPRDNSWFFAGCEITDTLRPRTHYYPANNHIGIQLPRLLSGSPVHLAGRIGHEVIHLLSPSVEKTVTNLEEGLAEVHAAYMTSTYFGLDSIPAEENYRRAWVSVMELLALDENAIKKAREFQPKISNITADILLKCCPNLRTKSAQFLADDFQHDYTLDRAFLNAVKSAKDIGNEEIYIDYRERIQVER